jgi:hypothetical protein
LGHGEGTGRVAAPRQWFEKILSSDLGLFAKSNHSALRFASARRNSPEPPPYVENQRSFTYYIFARNLAATALPNRTELFSLKKINFLHVLSGVEG